MPVPSFADIGKAAKDILYGGKEGAFQYDQKIGLVSKTTTGLTFTINALKTTEKLQPSLKLAYSAGSFSVDGTISHTDKVPISTSVTELAPGLKLSGSVVLPELSSGKVKVDYVMPYLNLQLGAGLTSAPVVDATVSTGYESYILGGDVAYDTSKSAIAKWNVGAGYHAKDYQIGVIVEKGESVKALLAKTISSDKSVGVEVTRKIAGGDTSFALGFARKLENGAATKVKLDNLGLVSFLYETKLTTGEKVALSAQVDATNLTKPVKTGLAIDLN